MKRRAALIGVGCWLLMVGAGFALLARHSRTGTPNKTLDSSLPLGFLASADLEFEADGIRIFMAIHPHCPCTAASLSELRRLLLSATVPFECTVLVYYPEGEDIAWCDSKSTSMIKEMQKVALRYDPDGELAKQLGIQASGGVLVFDEQGRELFSGGLTSGRGCPGQSLGAAVVEAILSGQVVPSKSTVVYGCEIISSEPKRVE